MLVRLLSLFTRIVLMTLPKPFPLTPPTQPNSASFLSNSCTARGLASFLNTESLPPSILERLTHVIQRRTDGTINFYRGWEQYKNGFGQASSEYWLGLENIHLLSGKKSYKLRVDMEDFDGAKAFVEYSSFNVAPEMDGYRLTLSGFKDGGAGNSLDHHNGHKFSTFDKDQDSDARNCAKTYLGGWWYDVCHHVNPNGEYLWGESIFGVGINWNSWKGWTYSLKAIAFKLSPQLELDAIG
uniref:Fibrinogen C-terminal domain-containing protein n=1 Tax=Gadus morhua TaxID=8049 RepID=A0A8C5BY77_GADMO